MLDKLSHLPRDARDTLFLLAVIAWVIAPQTAYLPLWCSALAACVLLWRARIAWQGQSLPSKGWLISLLIVTVGATLATHRTVLGREAGTTLIVVLLTLKTLELRAQRDAFVVFFLGFFTMLTNFFFSQSLLVAVAMLIALMGLLTALVNAHRMTGHPALMDSLKTAGFITALGAPIMALLFVLFPRLSPLWGMPGDAMSGRSGLSGSMQVGALAKLALDDSIAMRIRFEGQPPPQSQMYFRGPVFSAFDGRQWRPANSVPTRRIFQPSSLQTQGEGVKYEVTLEPTHNPWVFFLEAPIGSPQVAGHEITMTPELSWFSNRPINDLVRYSAISTTQFTHGPTRTMSDLQDMLALPTGLNPRTLALATEIRSDARFAQADARVLVAEVMRRLRTGGYNYTLEPGIYGQHTSDEFWFDKKEGFCEHIASSFVILMRALAVPARLVTGYQGGDTNPVDGFWTVRQRDAHAWAEVWQAGIGWQRVDPTGAVAPGRIGTYERLTVSPAGVAQALGTVMPPNLVSQLRASWEALNNTWNQWVLTYSQSRQLDLLKNLGFTSPSWHDAAYLLAGSIGVFGLIGAGLAWFERRTRDPWQHLLQAARSQLERAGLVSNDTVPARQLAQRAIEELGERAKPMHDWLLQLEWARYAPGAKLDIAGLRRQLRQMPPLMPPAHNSRTR